MSQQTEDILQQFKDCIPLLEVLTDVNRQAIIMLLAQNKSGLNVNTIAGHINLSRPAVSHHLKVLKQSGFIKSEKKGVVNYCYDLASKVEGVDGIHTTFKVNGREREGHYGCCGCNCF